MDPLDFRILVAAFEDPRQGYRSIGRQVGLSAPAVRARMQRLTEQKVLNGYALAPVPILFRREQRIALFQGDWSRAAVEAVLRCPDVAWVAWKVDGGVSVEVWPRPGTDAISPVTATLGTTPFFQTVSPAPALRPANPLDWRIIDALLDDPTSSDGAVVDRTGLSPKTVRHRLAGLLGDGLISISPRIGSLSASGDVLYTITILGPVPFSEVRHALGDAALLRQVSAPPAQYALCRAAHLAEVTTRTAALKRLPGVESAFVSLNREQLHNLSFVRALIRHEIEAHRSDGGRS